MAFLPARPAMSARSIVLLGLMMIFALASFAQQWPVSWMVIPSTITCPTSPCVFNFNLPGYSNGSANDVQVSITTVSGGSFKVAEQPETFALSGLPVGPYTWGTSANVIGFGDLSPTQRAVYTITFTFKGPPPDPRKLLLAIVGLAGGPLGTTVEVSQPGVAQPTNPPTLLQYTFTPPYIPITSSPTLINTTSNAPCSSSTTITGQCVSSGWTSTTGTDPLNTGWALFQATGPINAPPPLFFGAPSYPALSVTVNHEPGDGIGFTLGYATVPDACCPPFDKDIMLQQLVLSQLGGVTGPITYSFTNSAPYNTQLQAYLDYLHSLNSTITNLSVGWNVYDLGTALPPGTGPLPFPGLGAVSGSPAYTQWGCTTGSPGCNGGGGNLTFSTNPMTNGVYPIISNLQPNEWYGFSISITLNDEIQFWMDSCNSFTATFAVIADPASLVSVGNQNLIAVEVREPGAKTGHVVMLPLHTSGEGPRN